MPHNPLNVCGLGVINNFLQMVFQNQFEIKDNTLSTDFQF